MGPDAVTVADSNTGEDSYGAQDLIRSLNDQKHIYKVTGLIAKYSSKHWNGTAAQAAAEVSKVVGGLLEWEQCIRGNISDFSCWGAMIRKLGEILTLHLCEQDAEGGMPRSKLVTNGISALNKKTWRPDALVVDCQLERGADRTKIDLPDIRAIIAQTWALPVYMPLHVINFAKEMMNARPDRTSIHCLLFSGNDWYLAVVDRAGACVEHGGTLRIGQDIEGVEKFLTALASFLLMSDEELGLGQFIKVATPESAVVALGGRNFSFNPSKPIRRSRGRLISRATTIFGITSELGIIKISWPDITTQADELVILKAIIDRTADLGGDAIVRDGQGRAALEGIPELLGGEVFGTINGFRSGLAYKSPVLGNCEGEIEPKYLGRQFTCVAITPIGQPIRTVQSAKELITVIRDVTRIVRDLFRIDIIHRDISIGNILYTCNIARDSISGLLIDYDHAINLQNPQRDNSYVGTVPFMSIRALVSSISEIGNSCEQTYLDDLESLLYVFITLVWELHEERGP